MEYRRIISASCVVVVRRAFPDVVLIAGMLDWTGESSRGFHCGWSCHPLISFGFVSRKGFHLSCCSFLAGDKRFKTSELMRSVERSGVVSRFLFFALPRSSPPQGFPEKLPNHPGFIAQVHFSWECFAFATSPHSKPRRSCFWGNFFGISSEMVYLFTSGTARNPALKNRLALVPAGRKM